MQIIQLRPSPTHKWWFTFPFRRWHHIGTFSLTSSLPSQASSWKHRQDEKQHQWSMMIISITSSSWGRLPLLTNAESTPATDHQKHMMIIIINWWWGWWEYPRCWSRLCQFGWTLESWQSCLSWWVGGRELISQKLKPTKYHFLLSPNKN